MTFSKISENSHLLNTLIGNAILDDDFIEVYDMIAEKRGALTKGGIADYDRVSHIIIQDFKNGYFGPITFDRIK